MDSKIRKKLTVEALAGFLKICTPPFDNKGPIRKTKVQTDVLEELFLLVPYPNKEETENISILLQLPNTVIVIWFQNKRNNEIKMKRLNKKLSKQYRLEIDKMFDVLYNHLSAEKRAIIQSCFNLRRDF